MQSKSNVEKSASEKTSGLSHRSTTNKRREFFENYQTVRDFIEILLIIVDIIVFSRSYSQDDSCSVHVPTPPSSPHIDFSQQHAYLSANASNNLPQNYQYLMAQQYLDHYRFLFDQQHPYGYNMMEGIHFFFSPEDEYRNISVE